MDASLHSPFPPAASGATPDAGPVPADLRLVVDLRLVAAVGRGPDPYLGADLGLDRDQASPWRPAGGAEGEGTVVDGLVVILRLAGLAYRSAGEAASDGVGR